MRRTGAIFTPTFPPEHLRATALAAEAAGVPELWLWEDCFRESAFAAASAVLAWTEHLRVGIGITPMPLRNIALNAMEIATLERVFPGRVIPGVGHGTQSWMGQVGARAASPLTLMREYVPALRALLAGEEVTTQGRYVQLDRVQLFWPPAKAPALIAAAEGPKTLRIAGEVADGVLLSAGWTPNRIREVLPLIGAGAAAADAERVDAAGVDAAPRGIPEIIAFVVTAFGERTAARARADAQLASWKLEPQPELALVGSPAEVAESMEAFYAAGVTSVILQPCDDEPGLEAFMGHAGEVARLLG